MDKKKEAKKSLYISDNDSSDDWDEDECKGQGKDYYDATTKMIKGSNALLACIGFMNDAHNLKIKC